jgi:hypothetical protein
VRRAKSIPPENENTCGSEEGILMQSQELLVDVLVGEDAYLWFTKSPKGDSFRVGSDYKDEPTSIGEYDAFEEAFEAFRELVDFELQRAVQAKRAELP